VEVASQQTNGTASASLWRQTTARKSYW